jgi:hypothetical protein
MVPYLLFMELLEIVAEPRDRVIEALVDSLQAFCSSRPFSLLVRTGVTSFLNISYAPWTSERVNPPRSLNLVIHGYGNRSSGSRGRRAQRSLRRKPPRR